MKQKNRRLIYGVNLLIFIVLLAGLLIAFNYLAAHYHRRFDLTAGRQFSLSEESRKVVDSLKNPVKITTFFAKSYSDSHRVYDLLAEYQNVSNKITVEKVDPIANPALTQEKGITSSGVVLFESGSKREVTTVFGEQEVTNSLIKIKREKIKNIYFLTGHGEHDSKNSNDDGYSYINTRLSNQGYSVKTLEMLQSIPKDCDLLIIGGAKKLFGEAEIATLNDYLETGGRLFLMLDPQLATGLEKMMDAWGITVGNDLVVDSASYFWQDVATPVILRYYQHPIVYGLSATFFPRVRSITKNKEFGSQLTVLPIMMTTSSGWAETDFEKIQFDEGVDQNGPITIGIAIIKSLLLQTASGAKPAYSRIVVVGDSDFAANKSAKLVSNADFFMNSINWLTEEEDLISLRPKEAEQRLVQLTGTQVKTLFYVNVLLVPLLVIACGSWVWWRRR